MVVVDEARKTEASRWKLDRRVNQSRDWRRGLGEDREEINATTPGITYKPRNKYPRGW